LAVADIQSEPGEDDFGMKQIIMTILLPAAVFGGVGYVVGKRLPFVIDSIGPVTFAFIIGMLPIMAYFAMLVKKAGPEEKPGLAALIPVYIAGGAFFMILHLSGGLLTVFAEHSTDRRAEWIPKATDFYAQKAMPSYFGNAGPDVPRPDERTLVVVGGEGEAMFGARILSQSVADDLTGSADPGLTLGDPSTVAEDERFFSSKVYPDSTVQISKDKDAHGVTTTSVKVVPENAEPTASGVLTKTIDGKTVPAILVSQETRDSVYRNTDADTPTLAAGKYVRLVNAEMITGLLNPVFVVLLTPLVVAFFAWRAKKGKPITTARKIFYGMVITAISLFIVVIGASLGHDGAAKTSMLWLALYYLVITTGELCLSPMGLSLVTKLSPKRLVGLMMGGWFLATSIGNKLSGFISGLEPTAQMFTILAVAILGVAAFIYALLPRLDSAIKKYGA
jgi:dipeptide/tripeptide permease